MRILVEPSDYVLLNAAMLEVALTRLSVLQPQALIEVLTDTPDRFPQFGPNVRPFGATGRHASAAQQVELSRAAYGRLNELISARRRRWRIRASGRTNRVRA